MIRRAKSNLIIGIFFMSPVLVLASFIVYSVLYGLRFSLFETSYLQIVKFVGLKNYWKLLNDPRAIDNIINSLEYLFGSLILALPIGIGLALFLNKRIKLLVFFRGAMIVPWVMSQTVIALLWIWLLNRSFGPVNYTLILLGRQPIDFFMDSFTAKITVILANVWRSYPLAMVFTLAALQSIPKELNEAARVDGANSWVCLRYITIPYIWTTLVTVTILLSLEYLKMVTLIYVMTGGGPMHSTEVMSVRAYKEAFWHWNMNIGTSMASLILILNVTFSAIYLSLIKRRL